MVLLLDLFRDDTGRILGEEALAGRTSLAESGVAGVPGTDDKSKVGANAWLDTPTTIVGI